MPNHRLFTTVGVVAALSLGAAATAVWAASPQAYAELDRQSAAACITASGLRQASVGPPVRFSDAVGIDARTVSGVYTQPHMRAARGTMLCLYNRRTRRAEVQESAPQKAPQPGSAAQVKDVRWRAQEIGRRPVLPDAPITLMFGSDGKVTGRSGCNQFSGNYQLTGTTLKVFPQLIGTRMACATQIMEQEQRFQRLLVESRTVEVTQRGDLILTAGNNVQIRFTPEARR